MILTPPMVSIGKILFFPPRTLTILPGSTPLRPVRVSQGYKMATPLTSQGVTGGKDGRLHLQPVRVLQGDKMAAYNSKQVRCYRETRWPLTPSTRHCVIGDKMATYTCNQLGCLRGTRWPPTPATSSGVIGAQDDHLHLQPATVLQETRWPPPPSPACLSPEEQQQHHSTRSACG